MVEGEEGVGESQRSKFDEGLVNLLMRMKQHHSWDQGREVEYG